MCAHEGAHAVALRMNRLPHYYLTQGAAVL